MKMKFIIYFNRAFYTTLTCAALMLSCNQSGQERAADAGKNTTAQQKEKPVKPAVNKVTGYAPVNGMRMYYEIHGEGKPIVLLHGSFMTIPLNWKKMIPALAKNRQVIAVELQGHGRTADTDREVTYENLADDVSELLKYLKIDSADILGYSLGAGVAIQTGIRHPGQVRRLVVISGVYQYKGWHPDARAIFPHMNADMFRSTPLKTQYDSLAPDTTHWETFVNKVAGLDKKDFDWAANFRNIQAPMLIMAGDADGVSLEHVVDMFKLKGWGKMGDFAGISLTRLAIIPGASHVGIMEKTDWTVPMVEEFLEAKPQPAPVMH